MTIIENIYNVGKIKQLVDLNSDKTNFELNFKVASKNKLPFYALVVNQRNLDNDEKLDYKHVTNGNISGNIVSDKDVYQSYFLLLKADETCECNVSIDIKDIPANIPPQQPDFQPQQQPNFQQPNFQQPNFPNFQQPNFPPPHQQQPNFQQHPNFPPPHQQQPNFPPKRQINPPQKSEQKKPVISPKLEQKSLKIKSKGNNYTYIIIGIVIFAVIIMLYNYYKTDIASVVPPVSQPLLSQAPVVQAPVISLPSPTETSSIVSDIKSALNANDLDLINRLNSLNL